MNDFNYDPFNFDWDSSKMNNDSQGSQNNHVIPQIWSNVLEKSEETFSEYSYCTNTDRKKNMNVSQKGRELSPNTQKNLLSPNMICNMDPSKLKLSHDDLQIKPFYFKAKKSHIDIEKKDSKYWKKREKNNMAARKSRVSRRIKDNQVTLRARYLEKENETLKIKVDHLEKKVVTLEEKLKITEQSVNVNVQSMDEFVNDIRSLLE